MTAIVVSPTGGCSEARRCPGLATLVIVGAGPAERRSYRFFEHCLVGTCQSRSEYRGQTAAMADSDMPLRSSAHPADHMTPRAVVGRPHRRQFGLPGHNGCNH